MNFRNEDKKLTEFLKELKIDKKTISTLKVYLKEHQINVGDYFRELQKYRPELLTDGKLMDIAISFYEGNLYETELQKLSVFVYEKELMIRENYKNSTTSEEKIEEQEELDKNREWYASELEKLNKKYKKNITGDE